MSHHSLYLITFLVFGYQVIAQTNSTNLTTTHHSNNSSILNKDEAVPLDTKITIPFSILGVLLILSGTPMAFWGGRNRWSSYFLTGAFLGALLVMTPILRFGVIEQDHNPSIAIQSVFVLACLISAIAAGAVAVIFWKGTRFLVGAGGGFVISLFILSLKTNSLIPPLGLRWVVILISSSLGFVLATIPTLTIHITLFATAAMGAAAVVLGIDCFTTGGLKEFWIYIIGLGGMFPKLAYFPFTVTIQAELGVMAGLFLMGASVQWRLLEVIRKKIDELKQLDQDRRIQEDAAAYRQSMALDADLALWEKRHGDDADDATMAASSPKKYHGRKSSQFSLLPRPLASPSSPHTPLITCDNTPRPSNDHLPNLDIGGGLAGSLGISVEDSTPNPPGENLNTSLEPAETILPLYNTPQKTSTQRTSAQVQPTVSIDFEKFENDRRVSRPPGAPASWTSPLGVMPVTPSGSNGRSKLSSPRPNSSRPMSYSPQIVEQQEELRPAHSHQRSITDQPPARPFSERVSSLPIRRSEDLPRALPRPSSRIIIGSYSSPAPPPPSSTPKRESKVMTIEELDHRHKSAMKKLQQPTTQKISAQISSSADRSIHHSRSTGNLAPASYPSVNKERDDQNRKSSFVSPAPHHRPVGRQEDIDHIPRTRLVSSSSTNQPPPSSTSPTQKTHDWLSY